MAMSEHMLVRDAALMWGLTERRVAGLCRSGKIPGAYKEGKSWYIPVDAVRPADGRVRTGAYKKADQIKKTHKKLPLPVGISDYRIASTQYYYVDKTFMIRDFLDERPQVSLFTRPRRFGKTLNMDMLRTFFEITDEDTSVYFRDKAIWKQGKEYQEYQGRYPVVFLTFKDIKCETWSETLEKLTGVIGDEYARHDELLTSAACNDVDKGYFRRVMERTAGTTELTNALLTLTKMLDAHYRIPPIIIIDEYDTPIQQGHTKDFYEQVILFMRNLFSGGFKDNKHLSFGFLTGILRVARESIFSGLNNLAINSILDDKYSTCFGFTPEEVRQMAAYYAADDHYRELCDWYDGYRFGGAEIFNPWSVINYFRSGCRPGTYWQSTGSNEIIGEVLSAAGPDIYERLQRLMQGETVSSLIDTDVIYPEIRNNPSSAFSFLLVAGYLKVVRTDLTFTNGVMCEIALPNKEISFVYRKEILARLADMIPPSSAVSIQEALFTGDAQKLKELMRKLLMETVSYYDTSAESFYHGLVLGLCVMMDSRYSIRSNRESGKGRFDIQLMPRAGSSVTLPGILIELKVAKKEDSPRLKSLAENALLQIHDRHYETEMQSEGTASILKYGVAFCGKEVAVVVE